MDSAKYPLRVLFTRTIETARKYLEMLSTADPAIKVHSPAVLVEGPESSAFHLCAEAGPLKIFVVNTDRGPYYNHPNVVYTMVKHYKAGAILYISGEVLGLVKPSRFHNFPSITMAQEEDAQAYFGSGIVGHTSKELEASREQSLSYLLSLEAREPKTQQRKGPRPQNKTPGAPKKQAHSKKKGNGGKPRRLTYDDSDEDQTPVTPPGVSYSKAANKAKKNGNNDNSTGVMPWENSGFSD